MLPIKMVAIKRRAPFLVGCLVLVCTGTTLEPNRVGAQVRENATVAESIQVLNEIMRIPANAIPMSMLKDAQAVAIIPRVIKGSFVIGARHGNGLVLARDVQGNWQAPVFITLTGGNVGWQVGVQSTDVILVFKSRTSVDSLLSGKFTIGADAAAAAGPVGRAAAAATDGRLQAEVYSYSRSRGLFAGVSIDGSVIRLDQIANGTYYRPPAPGQPPVVPDTAIQLVRQLMIYTGELAAPTPNAGPVQSVSATTNLAQTHSQDEASAVRDQLARLSPQLYELLDPNWQNYLALPAEIFSGNAHPSPQVLAECINRFDTVRRDPRYSTLTQNPQFQSVYGLLLHYQNARSASSGVMNLPAPPPR